MTLRLCGGHAAFLTAGRAPAPRSAANVTKGWLVTPQDLSPRKPDAVSRTRGPGPSGGSWRLCRGQGDAGGSEGRTSAGRLRRRLGAAGRVHQVLAQTGGRLTCSPRPSEKPPGPPPQPPPASPTLVLSTRLPTEPRGERPLPRLSPATPAGRADRRTRHVAEPPLGGTGAFRWASAGSFNALLCGEGRVRLLHGSLHLPEDVIRPGSRAVFSLNIAKFPSSCTFRLLDAVTRARRGQDGLPSSRRPDLSRRPVPWFPQEAVGL